MTDPTQPPPPPGAPQPWGTGAPVPGSPQGGGQQPPGPPGYPGAAQGWQGQGAQWPAQPGQQPPQGYPGQPWANSAPPPKKSFFKRPWVLLSMGVLALIVIAAAMSGGGTDPAGTTPGAQTPGANQTQGSAPDEPTSKLPLQDGDWRLDSLTVEDTFGDFGGRARITYTGDDAAGGSNIFTITLFVGGKDVGTLQGAANEVAPNKTATVSLISTDKYVKGPYKYDFQNDL